MKLTTFRFKLFGLILLAGVFVQLFFSYILKTEDRALKQYQPNWNSIDSRPLPQWFDDAKVGIFLHWGVFSVPSFKNEWFWYFWQKTHDKETVEFMEKYYPPNFSYVNFAPQFKAEFFNPDQWVDVFKAAGAK